MVPQVQNAAEAKAAVDAAGGCRPHAALLLTNGEPLMKTSGLQDNKTTAHD
jgi:hypothetical protein